MCTVACSPRAAEMIPMDSPRLPVEPTTTRCSAMRARNGALLNAVESLSAFGRVVGSGRRPWATASDSAYCSTSCTPPRALTEPLTGRMSSRLSSTRPLRTPAAFCQAVASCSGDSMSPPAAAVSGKVAAIQGRKRSRRAAASSTIAGSTRDAESPCAASVAAGFHQVRGSSRARRAASGSARRPPGKASSRAGGRDAGRGSGRCAVMRPSWRRQGKGTTRGRLTPPGACSPGGWRAWPPPPRAPRRPPPG